MLIRDAVSSLFPTGAPGWRVYVAERMEQKSPFEEGQQAWHVPPADPIDVFAIAGYLLSRSGAYHHVQPETVPPDVGVRRLIVSASDRSAWCDAGSEWAGAMVLATDVDGKEFATLEAPQLVLDLWSRLYSCFDHPVFQPLAPDDDPPDWWRDALGLLATADEACRDVGFLAEEALQERVPQLSMLAAEIRVRNALTALPDGEGRGAYTLSDASPDVACVLPKSRTPALGCTLRSLSHNLALLPPRGLARARWIAPGGEYNARDSVSPLNLILVPYPFSVAAADFHVRGLSDTDAAKPWGWFGVEPGGKGGAEEIGLFVENLVQQAKADVGTVHGVIFPELALSGPSYMSLVERLARHADIELIVSGLHSDEGGRPGNFAAATVLPRSTAKDRPWVQDVRQKHHRWRLDGAQVSTYSLGAILDPGRSWWEKLDVLSRSLTVGVLRGETTVTTLICEDLARVDPAQELLRAIGPNIVIALLMDSAQLQTRWPNRYATVLAEDPGSSVLTFTSLGLLNRVNQTGFYPPSRCIALWRDDTQVKELNLPSDAQGLCITLSPSCIEESTLDGRSDRQNALAWRLSGVTPIKTKGEVPSWKS